jgi:hypothetical protein
MPLSRRNSSIQGQLLVSTYAIFLGTYPELTILTVMVAKGDQGDFASISWTARAPLLEYLVNRTVTGVVGPVSLVLQWKILGDFIS